MAKIILRIKSVFRAYKKYILIGVPVLILALVFVFWGNGDSSEAYTVTRTNVEQSVVLSGEVRTSDKADLGFASSGRIARINVANNQKVVEGQALAQLEIGDLVADLRIKEANLRAANSGLEAAKKELEEVTTEENTKVESAYRTLLSEDLELTPDVDSYDVDPPTLTGIYEGAEGRYKVTIEENLATLDFMVRTFGLEKTEKPIKKEAATPFGTKGLYISFPDEVSDYDDTTWYVDIPNRATTSYVTNYNAYNEAKKRRDVAIEQARAKYDKLLAEGKDSNTTVAEAEVQKIQAEIRKNTIYAPFNGIVTNIELEVGENASTGERVISVLGEKKLEVVLQVSELDVSRLVPGTVVKVALDAFPNETFDGSLTTINSRETEIEGVPVYEAFVELVGDPRIKTGMSAKGTIVLSSKQGVIAIPSYLILKEGDSSTVEVISETGKKETRQVTLGLVGSDSMVEVISGLSVGDKVLGIVKK